ncbi:hypothetical protein ACFV3E_24760 [Streptomyces sp. NPDC059718]
MPDLSDDQLEQLITDLGLRPRRGPGARAACGTPAGYQRHARLREQPCDSFRAANTRYRKAQTKAPIARPDRLKPIAHGTLAGYKAHRYRREQACRACLAAVRDYNAVRSAVRKGAAQ